MIPAPPPPDESHRLAALKRYAILDTPPEPGFDRVTRLAQRLFDVPIVLVSLVDADRQWFKSCIGLAVTETGRDESFCAHALHGEEVLIVPDALEDERFVDNPLVIGDPGIRFYAGAPLRTPQGVALGTLCIIDREPRPALTAVEQATLQELAAIVIDELDLRHALARAIDAEVEARAAVTERDRLMSRISHELRTPLNAILGFADLLTLDDLGEDAGESVGHIQTAGRHLLELVDEVLDLAHVDAPGAEPDLEIVRVLDVVAQAFDVLGPAAARDAIRLENHASCDQLLLADQHRLQQVVLRMLTRAIAQAPPSTEVTLGCTTTPVGTVRVEVRDHGRTLSDADLRRLFLPFERLEGAATAGVGLSSSQRLIAAMGGSMGARRHEGPGTTIWFELPATAPQHPHRTTTGDRAANRRIETVLYIENDPANQRLLSRAIAKRRNAEVLIAPDGMSGLELARAHGPDLVILDLGLPGMPGEAVLAELASGVSTSNIPVVVVSGETQAARASELQQVGAAAFVAKPFNLAALLTLLDGLLDGT